MTAADDLRATARYIEEVGFARGTAEVLGKGTAVCVLGGMARVCDLEPNLVAYNLASGTLRYQNLTLALRDYLRAQNIPRVSVPVWNDITVKDERELTVTLEKAAAWIEERG